MNWLDFAVKVPLVIQGLVKIIGKVKSASHADQATAVSEAIRESVALAEFAEGKDRFNDPVIKRLLDAVIAAEQQVLVARDALKAGLLNKAA